MLPDSICDLGVLSSLYARPPRLASESSPCTRAALQGRVEQCREEATGVCVQHGQPNVAVRAAQSLDTPRGVCGRAEPSAGAAGTRSTTSCKRCLTSEVARGCFTCASILRPLLSVTCRYGAEALRWFAAGSSATTASQLFPDFRPRCSGCAQARRRCRRAVPRPCAHAVPRTRWGSALAWVACLGALLCSEASNNAIESFDPFASDPYGFSNLIVDGLRVLCAPHLR
jgi:hypothetical protein